jgi:hypothetical protein
MRFFTSLLGLMLAVSASAATLQFNFGDFEINSTPTNFQSVLAGGGAPPVWKVISTEVPSAFSPLTGNTPALNRAKVLAQTSVDMTDERFPMFICRGETFRNFKFSAKFKIVSGITEQMAGLVFRFQNVSNFYVVRVSAAGHNVRFYKVVDGVRSNPLGPQIDIPVGEWHRLGVQCEGNQITVYLDDKLVMPALGDNTFEEGKLGFWTKSDSVTCFTEGVVDYTPRIPPAQQMVDTVMNQETRLVGLRIYTLDDTSTNTTHIIASNLKTEIGMLGGDSELYAIRDGTVSFGRDKGINNITMPLHDRNGDYIGAVRVKSKSFFGETQETALNRAIIVRKRLEEYCTTGVELRK